MSCKYGLPNCLNEGSKCDICFDEGQYQEARQKPVYTLKKHSQKDNRQGARFERHNHEYNQDLLNGSRVVTKLTPNSGAGYIKGDEQITGIIRCMEELKTRTVKQARGKETFTVKKEWLEKLTREALAENMEFWYLKFSFYQEDDTVYCIVPRDVLSSFVKTIVTDRLKTKDAARKIEAAHKQAEAAAAEATALRARVAALEAELRVLKPEPPAPSWDLYTQEGGR